VSRFEHLDGLYTQRFNRCHRRDGALFKGRYKAIVMDKDNYLAQVVRYIHLNPLEAGLVPEPELATDAHQILSPTPTPLVSLSGSGAHQVGRSSLGILKTRG
jgi:hypothetical protein